MPPLSVPDAAKLVALSGVLAHANAETTFGVAAALVDHASILLERGGRGASSAAVSLLEVAVSPEAAADAVAVLRGGRR